MEIERNTKIAEAAIAFSQLHTPAQDEIIWMIKRLLSEQGKYPAPPPSTVKTTE